MRFASCVDGFRISLLLMVLFITPDSRAREWTNNRGERLEANFVRLRGETAILRAKGKSIRAPIDKLSQADQQWIARHQELMAPRDWGETAINGEMRRLTRDGVEVDASGKRGVIPFAKLMVDDFDAIIACYEHLERELPEQFGAEREAALARAPPEGLVVRDWVDARGRRMRAGFEGFAGDALILWRGSKRFEFPVAKLSEADQAWVAQQGLGRLAADLQGGASATQSLAALAFYKAITSGRPMPTFPPPAVEPEPAPEAVAESPTQPAPPAEEQVMAAADYVSTQPSRGAPPWINDINDLSPNEADARLEEAFGPWVDSDEEIGGIAFCSHCSGEFGYPAGFSESNPSCPFCGLSLTSDSLEDWDAIVDESDGSWRTPWYFRRTGRRLIIFVVVTVLGAGVKLMLSGGD